MTDEVKEVMNIEGIEQVEDSFLDDDEDDGSIQNFYSYYRFPDDEPTSVRFKGKKSVFVKSVGTLKDLLKRGEGSNVNNVSFRVLDVRKMQHGIEYDIKCIKNQVTGVSVLKLYGPNPKKGCTIMICKSREYESKFVSMLSVDVIKYLLDHYEETDEWKTLLTFSAFKKPVCKVCKKSFCNEKNLKTHIKKYHTEEKIIKCELCKITCKDEDELKAHNKSNHTNNERYMCKTCKITFETENALKTHMNKTHAKDTDIKCGSCDYTVDVDNDKYMIDHIQQAHEKQDENDDEMEIEEDSDSKVNILEVRIKTMMTEHENKIMELTNKLKEKELFYETNRKRLEKEDVRKSNEIKKLKEENVKILDKLGELQWNKDKMDAEMKAVEKKEKIKQNLKLFNELIGKQENKCENIVSNENDTAMDVQDDDDIEGLQRLQNNKQSGYMRTTPQESPEVIRRIENCEKQIIHCPQCDFITPSEIFFNKHMTMIHTGPNCPFCFLPFDDYASLRKHCTQAHEEPKNKLENSKFKKPCRFFRNGEGNCSPRNGEECLFSHSIIPFSERQECFHKQSCKFKPFCIFYHPEGQNEENWQKSTHKISKICHSSQQGFVCMRSVCRYYHPTVANQDFQLEQLKKPPIMVNRVPVIVKNKNPLKNLNQSLKSMDLN